MEKKYSLAIQPLETIAPLKTMKEHLFNKVGNYGSKNSIAHITICELIIDESAIEKIKPQLFKICDTLISFQVYLDHFGSYDKVGAFYIAPNEESEINLQSVMKKIQDALRGYKIKKSNDPHMSIGRRLTPEKLKIASQLFTTIDLTFLCKEIVLREFDPIKRQFFVIETFPFGSNPQPELVQGSLF